MESNLSDGAVALRPLDSTDRDALYEAVRDSMAELGRWMPWCHPGYSVNDSASFIETAKQWWANQSQFTFAILDGASGTFAGTVAVNHINRMHRYANIGYWLRTSHTRRGLASRATVLAARCAFQHLGMMRLEIAAQPENTASRRVAERAGAVFEGIMRNRIVFRGQAVPAALYSLVPEDLVSS